MVDTSQAAEEALTLRRPYREQSEKVAWHTPAQTEALLAMMSDVNRAKWKPRKNPASAWSAAFTDVPARRIGRKVQSAEVRFDDIAGCLRTPAGGSSRQTIIVVEGSDVRTRLISPRETARLMGLPDTYMLPDNYNEAYHLTGDGLAVPVVRHLSSHIFSPIIALATERPNRAAA